MRAVPSKSHRNYCRYAFFNTGHDERTSLLQNSDCGKLGIFSGHKYVASPPKAVALAIEAGCDIDSGSVYSEYVLSTICSSFSPSQMNEGSFIPLLPEDWVLD